MVHIFKSVINNGCFDLPEMLKKIDSYHIQGSLTDQERSQLYTLARNGANPTYDPDIMKQIMNLSNQIHHLQHRMSKLEQGNTFKDQESQIHDPVEYVDGNWYQKDDQVIFIGNTYICTAPDGVVCTWSPAEYPAYWEIVYK